MNKTILSALMVGTLAASAAMPAAAANDKSLNAWQDCGIGAIIFPANGTAAAISNIIWDLGTTAVTSNASSQNSCSGEKAKTAMFIQATMPVLEQEVAVGEGEYVTAMLELRGCEAASHSAIINAVREDFAQKENDNAQALYETLEERVETSFSASCASV
ncbi:DUF3015 family protein [Thalassomonas sp. RHCl1]|uniref:DUF3015 family protein n=1 Tax=Thalassomonas sp. RHCl1 TaxID=2995320 RepID=UPI00248CDB79|nr:DUF3015 family protein [Thalassomonas sp. RHCl1]